MRVFFASIGITFLTFFLAPVMTQAVNPVDTFKKVVTKSDLIEEGKNVPTADSAVANIIRAILVYVGVIIVALIIYAGFLWATARGNDAQIKKAKTILVSSVIGLLIIFSASAIVDFVLQGIISAVS